MSKYGTVAVRVIGLMFFSAFNIDDSMLEAQILSLKDMLWSQGLNQLYGFKKV